MIRFIRGGGRGLFKIRPSREGAYSKVSLPDGALFETQIMFKIEAGFSSKNIVKIDSARKIRCKRT